MNYMRERIDPNLIGLDLKTTIFSDAVKTSIITEKTLA